MNAGEWKISIGQRSNIDYRWSKDFLEAGKKRLVGDVVREATSDEVKRLRHKPSACHSTQLR